jgi:hypothetical protein
LEAAGIVGGNQGSKARDVIIKTEHELEELLQQFRTIIGDKASWLIFLLTFTF